METVDERRRALAIRRIKDKRDFRIHLLVYLAVNTMLIAIWASGWSAATASNGALTTEFWPIFPIMGWGIGVAVHGYTAYRGDTITEDQIKRELDRLPR